MTVVAGINNGGAGGAWGAREPRFARLLFLQVVKPPRRLKVPARDGTVTRPSARFAAVGEPNDRRREGNQAALLLLHGRGALPRGRFGLVWRRTATP